MSAEKNDRYTLLLQAIDQERDAEAKYFSQLSEGKSIAERLDSGILWFPVVITNKVYSVGEQIELTVERTKHLDVPHKFKSGVGCRIFRFEGNSETNSIRGVVSYVRRDKLAIMLGENVISKSELESLKGHLGVELIYDDRPYKVMETAINTIMSSKQENILRYKSHIAGKEDDSPLSIPHQILPTVLNDSQKTALNGTLAASSISIIHGPPGTGKTTTLVQVVKALLKTEKKILVCAPSNNAVDLLAMKLDQLGISTLRVGNVTRIADGLTHVTLAEKARGHSEWQHIKKVKIEANEARRLAGKYKRSFGHKERGQRTAMYKEAKELKQWARDLEDKLMQSIITNCQVICSTLIGVSHKSIDYLRFQTLIIDEASQALEPECWNAMLRAERVILAGDHLQLAPTVKSKEALKLGLGDTLLTKLSDSLRHTFLLQTQYRMHKKILSFSNERFYENKLETSHDIAERSLDDMPLELIDTSGCGFEEAQNLKTLSRYNEGEYFILREHFLLHKEIYDNATIGIISPYSEQVKYIRRMVEEEVAYSDKDILIQSIDGFQGQERDVIYISLVRSNQNSEIGFLADERRLNVAMTRAKQKLVIIGDFSTLSTNKLFDDLIQHVELHGVYKSGWEYMDVS